MGLPVHRLDGSPKARVFAYKNELDRWLEEKLHPGKSPDAEAGWGPLKARSSVLKGKILGVKRISALAGLGCLAAATVLWLAYHGLTHRRVYDSIVVLPLEILSKEPGQGYYSEGLAEELNVRLFQVGALRVAEFGAVRDYRTSKKTYKDIRRDLDVTAILDAAALLIGNRIRIDAKLVDAVTERPIWAASYERDAADVLAIQAEISQAIVREVRVRLTPQERAKIASSQKVVPAAYEAFLEGKQLMQSGIFTQEKAQTVLSCFRQAIALDPEYPPFYWTLVRLYWRLHMWSLMPYNEIISNAQETLNKGRALDRDSPGAHLAAGGVALLKWEWEKARQELKIAVELSPGDPANHSRYTDVLHALGRFDESIASARRLVETDISHNYAHRLCLASNLADARQYDESISVVTDVLRLNPDLADAHNCLATSYAYKGMISEAVAEAEKSLALLPADEKGMIHLNNAVVYAWARRRKEAVKIIDDYLAYKRTTPGEPIDSMTISACYAVLNNMEEAFKWLERALDNHDFYIIWLKVDPSMGNLRSDPRFKDCLKRAGF